MEYLVDDKFIAEFRRLKNKIDNANGSAVIVNNPDALVIEATPPLPIPDVPDVDLPIEALLASRNSDDPFLYVWSQVRKTATGYTAVDGGLAGTATDHPAILVNGTTGEDLSGSYVVLVPGTYDSGDGKIKPCWYFWAAPEKFFGIIASATNLAAGQWSYSFNEAEKTAAGYAGWTAKSGGRSGTLYNLSEMIVGDYFGNGMKISTLPSIVAVQPIPVGVPVVIWTVKRSNDGTVEYWCQYENAVDGTCDA